MKRVVSVWCPRWAVDVYRRRMRSRGATPGRDEPAVILVRQEGQRRLVWGCCARAAAAGVRRGMPVAEARAALPATMATAPGACVVAEATPAADAGALRALALWAQRFSPWVSVDGEDGLLLDATGCEGVFGSERAMARAVLAGLRRLRIEARVAAAGTIGAAWAGARFGAAEREPVVIESGEARIEAALAGLPVAALRLEAETIAGLSEIGITRVGEVLALPRAVLPARFGGVVLRRVDEALGRVPEVLDPVREEAPIEASIVFDGPTTNVEAVSRAVREVVEAEWGVCAQLRAKERGARVLRVELARADLSPTVLEVVLSRPSRNGKHLRSLLAPRLERVEMGFGIEGVHARVTRSGPIGHGQMGLSGGAGECSAGDGGAGRAAAEASAALGMLVDTLANRLGAERVGRVRASPSHWPERAHAIAMGPETTSGVTAGVTAEGAGGAKNVFVPTGDRPTRLLTWAEPVEVGLAGPDGPVSWVKWGWRRGRGSGGAVPVVATLGPERIAPPWWRLAERESGMPGGATREYYKVQLEDGRWVWLCRAAEEGRWFVHGEWA